MGELDVDVRDGIGWLRLNRPEAMNSLTETMLDRLSEVLPELAVDPAVTSLVLTGTGRAFCAGADLKSVQAMFSERGTFLPFIVQAGKTFDELAAFPKPTIAAVNGITMAGGLEIAMCCDFIVAAESARLGDGHANYGLMPGGGGSIRLPRRVGPATAKFLLYTGRLLPAHELVACGLVSQVVPDDELTATVEAIAADIGRKSPLGLARMKQLVDDGLEQPLPVALRQELLAFELHSHSFDLHEGLAAFNEKRDPQFLGR